MSVKVQSIRRSILVNREYRPALRYAFGATMIMALAMAFGGYLGYVIPYLSLNFLIPGVKMPSFKKGVGFVIMVALTSLLGYLFTAFFYDYTWLFIPLLGLMLFYVFYTVRFTFIVKLFLIISLLAYPVPSSGIDPTVWSFLVARTLISGAIFSVLVVWIVYTLFPDVPVPGFGQDAPSTAAPKPPGRVERFNHALEVLIVTFPVVLLFILYQWYDGLLILIYIVVLAMRPDAGKSLGRVKIHGNLIGGAATLIFYWLIVIVPSFLFFIVLFLGTALFFADKIFSGKPDWSVYKTSFAALVLIIGSISTHITDTASTEIWQRIIMIMSAVLYVVVAFSVVENFKAFLVKKAKMKDIK